MTIIFLTFFILSLAALAASNFWLSEWSNDSEDPVKAENNKYFRSFRISGAWSTTM